MVPFYNSSPVIGRIIKSRMKGTFMAYGDTFNSLRTKFCNNEVPHGFGLSGDVRTYVKR